MNAFRVLIKLSTPAAPADVHYFRHLLDQYFCLARQGRRFR